MANVRTITQGIANWKPQSINVPVAPVTVQPPPKILTENIGKCREVSQACDGSMITTTARGQDIVPGTLPTY